MAELPTQQFGRAIVPVFGCDFSQNRMFGAKLFQLGSDPFLTFQMEDKAVFCCVAVCKRYAGQAIFFSAKSRLSTCICRSITLLSSNFSAARLRPASPMRRRNA